MRKEKRFSRPSQTQLARFLSRPTQMWDHPLLSKEWPVASCPSGIILIISVPNMLMHTLGEILDPLLVRAAIMEELNYFNDKVWEIETIDRMKEIKDHVHVRSRLVLCNKGDGASPDIRARLVACEINC